MPRLFCYRRVIQAGSTALAFFGAQVGSLQLQAGPIPVPNASFESPATSYVSINVDAWQKAPKPDWYVETGGFSWGFNIGIFKNTAPGSSDHIVNCHSNQAIWLFVVPELGLFQDYDSVDWRNPVPSRAFDARYEVGKSYQLTVGVVGTGGGMQEGATMEIGLYYRDASSNRVTAASLPITNTPQVFTTNTQLIDFTLHLPIVQPSDPWAGKHIGIQMFSTVSTNLQGGYWDLDNVRLSSTLEPTIENPRLSEGQFQFTLLSEPGMAIEILAASDPGIPLPQWTRAAAITNQAGSYLFTDSALPADGRYYRARRLPQ